MEYHEGVSCPHGIVDNMGNNVKVGSKSCAEICQRNESKEHECNYEPKYPYADDKVNATEITSWLKPREE